MSLELHVWGPAFGLPSLDPECLAVIAYFTQALHRSAWTLIRSSPSAVPTHRLPTVYSPLTTTWTAGLSGIITQLRSQRPPTFRDPDSGLSASAWGTTTAYAAYIASAASPLLALSLYASPANWTTVTRPAYSAALPFPLGWTEVAPVRHAWVAVGEPLGLDLVEEEGGKTASDAKEGSLPADQGTVDTGILAGLKKARAEKDEEPLTPEQKPRVQLNGLIGEVLGVLAELKAEHRWFLGETNDGKNNGPTTLDCTAFGYLALMVIPDLPRPWLREEMTDQYPSLCTFVQDMRFTCFDGMASSLPWSEDASHDSILNVNLRLAQGAIHNIPGVGNHWQRWWAARNDEGSSTSADLLLALGATLAAAVLVRGFVFHHHIPPLGAPLQRWERPQSGLRGFGAAGALFGFMPEMTFGDDRESGVGTGGMGLSTEDNGLPGGGAGGGKLSPGEMGVEVDISLNDVD